VPIVRARYWEILQRFWRMGVECHVSRLNHPTLCEVRYGRRTVSVSGLNWRSLPPNFDETFIDFGACRDCHVWCLSHPPEILSETGMKNCLGWKSKVPFISARFHPNLLWLWSMRGECHKWCWVTPLHARREWGRKNVSSSRVKYFSLLTDSNKLAVLVALQDGQPHVMLK
jgi:hypothetical protein